MYIYLHTHSHTHIYTYVCYLPVRAKNYRKDKSGISDKVSRNGVEGKGKGRAFHELGKKKINEVTEHGG